MRVAQVAPLYNKTPPLHWGSVERIAAGLSDRLAALGHDVTLFAAGGSRTNARLVEMTAGPLWQGDSWPDATAARFDLLGMLSHIYSRADEFDIIHSHVDIYTLPFSDIVATPSILTLHSRMDLDYLPRIHRRFRRTHLVSVSKAQQQALPDANWRACIPCGIPVRNYAYRARPGDYLAFMGRITPVKRPDLAVRVAARSGYKLKVAGVIMPSDHDYYASEIAPLFKEYGVDFLGSLSDGEKSEFFGGAFATLFPSEHPEPFGMVILESLACGTPVIALRGGAIEEIFAHGTEGYVCDHERDMPSAVHQIGLIDRLACRRRALKFNESEMVKRYEALYTTLIRERSAR